MMSSRRETKEEREQNPLIPDPHHHEAEKSVLSALMNYDRDGSLTLKVFDLIQPESFFIPGHQTLAEWILDRRGKGEPTNIVAFSTALEANGELKKLFVNHWGEHVMGTMIDIHGHASTSAHTVFFAERIQDAWYRRQAIEACRESIKALTFPDGEPASDLISDCQEKLAGITLDFNEVRMEAEVVSQAYDEIQEAMASEKPLGFSTGFGTLDRAGLTFLPGQVVVIAAATSVGKTVLAAQILDHLCGSGFGGLYITKEMPGIDLQKRFLSQDVRRDVMKLKSTDVADIQMLGTACRDRTARNKMGFRDVSKITITILETLIRVHANRGMKFFVVDYIQLMDPTAESSKLPRNLQIAEITRRCKTLAMKLKIVLFEVSQLKRLDKKRNGLPDVTDASDSKTIEDDADVMLIIDRERGSSSAKIRVGKNRSGPTSDWLDIGFHGDYTKFVDL
jgi:replicative DNA helicase